MLKHNTNVILSFCNRVILSIGQIGIMYIAHCDCTRYAGSNNSKWKITNMSTAEYKVYKVHPNDICGVRGIPGLQAVYKTTRQSEHEMIDKKSTGLIYWVTPSQVPQPTCFWTSQSPAGNLSSHTILIIITSRISNCLKVSQQNNYSSWQTVKTIGWIFNPPKRKYQPIPRRCLLCIKFYRPYIAHLFVAPQTFFSGAFGWDKQI